MSKKGVMLSINFVLMAAVLIGVPVWALHYLDEYTHHGEKVEVPNLSRKTVEEAEAILAERGLVAVVEDSVYEKYATPGTVLAQSPKAGVAVKSDRAVYLTVNQGSAPLVELPDVAARGSMREAVSMLKSVGFRLTDNEVRAGHPKDLVLGVRQGGRELSPGERVSPDRPLTLVVGGGEVDTLEFEEEFDPEDVYGLDF